MVAFNPPARSAHHHLGSFRWTTGAAPTSTATRARSCCPCPRLKMTCTAPECSARWPCGPAADGRRRAADKSIVGGARKERGSIWWFKKRVRRSGGVATAGQVGEQTVQVGRYLRAASEVDYGFG
eukprot:6182248-Pleurochrysis_carterae.AAC.3